jgi:CheY-like chemotaxis protein
MNDLKILILEDSPDDAALMQITLKRAGLKFRAKVVDSRKDFIDALDSFAPDVIISDHKLPRFYSNQALQIAREKLPYTPFILVTGLFQRSLPPASLKKAPMTTF